MSNKTITGQLVDIKQRSIYPVSIDIKNGKIIEGKSADENGTLHITKKPIAEKLQIHFVGYKPAEIKLKDLKTDSFEITLIQEPNYYEYFTNRKFKIINNQILSIKSKKGQNKIYRQK